MKKLLSVLAAFCIVPALLGHPGNGIAVAADGTVYFSDVGRKVIWKLAAGGEPEVFVEDRWTHSLVIDDDDVLYYEREHPDGGPAPASFWRVGADGTHEMLVPPQRDRRNFSGGNFVIDSEGDVFYAHDVRGPDNKWRRVIMRRTALGDVSEFSGMGDGLVITDGAADVATIRNVTAMAAGPDGSIYLADRDRIRRVETRGDSVGRVTTIASGLTDERPVDPPERRGPSSTINRLFGLTVMDSGECLVAYQAGRRVMRVGADGATNIFYSSPKRWSPLGVTTMGDDTYVLEVRDRDIERLRVLRVGEGGEVEVLAELG